MNEKSMQVLRQIKAKLEFMRAHFWLRATGNSLGAKLNLLYLVQHQVSRLKSRELARSEAGVAEAKELKALGFVKIEGLGLEKLSEKVASYFSTHPLQNGVGYVDRSVTPTYAPYILEALNQLAPILQHYFGSHFQVYWSNVMRYDATGNHTAASSFGYHIDDNPTQLLKIFLYLNDTYESNGAFRCFNYQRSSDLLRQGFLSYSNEARVASQKFITPELERRDLRVLEGKKGTALIFDNNLVHKGTPPRQGYRDVVVIEVYPDHRPHDAQSVLRSLSVEVKSDFPKNPFKYDLTLPRGPSHG